MKLIDILKLLFGDKLEEDIKDINTTEDEKDNKDSKEEGDDKQEDKADEKEDDKKEEDKQEEDKQENNGGGEVGIFEEGWFNSETGVIDESKIKDAEVLKAIKLMKQRETEQSNKRAIEDAVNTELGNYKLVVKPETVKKLIDLSAVTIGEDGVVKGVKEAIDKLKEVESGFFKEKDDEDGSPLDEGFNPVDKKAQLDRIPSVQEALKMMREMEQ